MSEDGLRLRKAARRAVEEFARLRGVLLPKYEGKVAEPDIEIIQELEEAVMAFRPEYDPEFGDDRICICGHPYHRHFDSYDAMYPVGCKYCPCMTFTEASDAKTQAG